MLSGAGMALFFAPVANVVLSSVGAREEGQASGANNAIRELGGVFGVAVLASIFAHYGGYRTGDVVRRRDERRRLRRRCGRRARRRRGVRDQAAPEGHGARARHRVSRSLVAAAATAAATTASTRNEPRNDSASAVTPTSGGPISSPT